MKHKKTVANIFQWKTPVTCLFKNLLRLKINILTPVNLEINFPAKPVMKINSLSRPNLPATPPPLRIKWSSPNSSSINNITLQRSLSQFPNLNCVHAFYSLWSRITPPRKLREMGGGGLLTIHFVRCYVSMYSFSPSNLYITGNEIS